MTPRQDHGGKANHADWQPIETAPHYTNGPILVCRAGEWGSHFIVINRKPGQLILRDGAFDTRTNDYPHVTATHWMALPPPPSDSGS